MDFKSILKNKGSFNTILVFINRLGKRLILILYYKTSITRELAHYFITYVWCYYRPSDLIVLDRGL
jgi:hypothetical protein